MRRYCLYKSWEISKSQLLTHCPMFGCAAIDEGVTKNYIIYSNQRDRARKAGIDIQQVIAIRSGEMRAIIDFLLPGNRHSESCIAFPAFPANAVRWTEYVTSYSRIISPWSFYSLYFICIRNPWPWPISRMLKWIALILMTQMSITGRSCIARLRVSCIELGALYSLAPRGLWSEELSHYGDSIMHAGSRTVRPRDTSWPDPMAMA